MKRNAARDRADAAFRAAVYRRYGRACVKCGDPATDVAHIIRRGYDRTRCMVENARPLCGECHREQTANRWHWRDLIGDAEYDRLYALANDPSWKRPPDHWQQCLTVLKG